MAGTPGASFAVNPLSIPVRDWIGVRLFEGSEAEVLQSNVRRFDTVGNWYQVLYIYSNETPIDDLAFTPHAEVCLPVPSTIPAALLDDVEVMLLLDNGVQQLLNSPMRQAADFDTGTPAQVCARASTFDGLIFLVLPEALQPTATPIPPTETPEPTPDSSHAYGNAGTDGDASSSTITDSSRAATHSYANSDRDACSDRNIHYGPNRYADADTDGHANSRAYDHQNAYTSADRYAGTDRDGNSHPNTNQHLNADIDAATD